MARRQQEDPKAEMTPMIDVVFQLMIFFIVTIKQEDIFSKLNACAPSPSESPSESAEDKDKIEIQVGTLPPEKSDKNTVGVVIGGAAYTYEALDKYLKERAKLSTETPVHLMCPLESPHGNLDNALGQSLCRACMGQNKHRSCGFQGV